MGNKHQVNVLKTTVVGDQFVTKRYILLGNAEDCDKRQDFRDEMQRDIHENTCKPTKHQYGFTAGETDMDIAAMDFYYLVSFSPGFSQCLLTKIINPHPIGPLRNSFRLILAPKKGKKIKY